MNLSPQAIKEYQEIHLTEFGEVLSDKDAEIVASKMFTFVTTIFNQRNKSNAK